MDEISVRAPEPAVELRTIPDLLSWHNAKLRRDVSEDIMRLFKISNLMVLIGVAVIFCVDTILVVLNYERSADRLIDAKVIMTLIGATAVQLGSMAFLMAKSLYAPDDVTRSTTTNRSRRRNQKPPPPAQNADDDVV